MFIFQTPAIDFNAIQQAILNDQGVAGGSVKISYNSKLLEVLQKFIPTVYLVAGLILFGMLIVAGYGFLTAGGDSGKMQAAQSKITTALTGFAVVFFSYWLIRAVEIIFGLTII